jgi:hypothetical protein
MEQTKEKESGSGRQDEVGKKGKQKRGKRKKGKEKKHYLSYPNTMPTMDITAHDRVYLSRAVNHAPGSGNISTNHSWKTGGKLFSRNPHLSVLELFWHNSGITPS